MFQLRDIVVLVCAITFIIVFYKVFTKKIADVRELSKDAEKIAERAEERHKEIIAEFKEITEILRKIEKK